MSDDDQSVQDTEIDVVYEAAEYVSSEDPPMEEWSSLDLVIREENKKKKMFEKGLYSPGSGEICAQYIAMSTSSIFQHPFYDYPAVDDPGIEKALLRPEKPIIYPHDGQELYLAVCKEMSQSPVGKFYRGLVENNIDLKYYCVSSPGVRAMARALESNRTVTSLNLTGSILNLDACFHLGEMLNKNSILVELNLSGCKIGAFGVKRILSGLLINRSLQMLNLNKNDLGDNGAQFLADAVFAGLDIKKICLSDNKIGSKGAGALANAFETYNKFSMIDLSWNNLCSPVGVYNLLIRLSENKNLQELNLSWNSMGGPRLASGVKNVINAPNLRSLNLSNNRFTGDDITTIIQDLNKAKKLNYFNLSYNPLTVDDSLKVLTKAKSVAVKVQELIMENVPVNAEFLQLIEKFKLMKSKKNVHVVYGREEVIFQTKGPDLRDVLLNRVEYLRQSLDTPGRRKSKKKKRPGDLALVAMQLLKDNLEVIEAKEFSAALSAASVPINSELADGIIDSFAKPKGKARFIDIKKLVEHIKKKWPEKKLPPTPPPEPAMKPITENN